jgi:hypothetical protein
MTTDRPTIFDHERDHIRTLEAELTQARADARVLALCVLQFEQSAGIKEEDRHPLVADALSRAGGKP